MPSLEFIVESATGPISLKVPEGVMTPSPYSEFMAKYMPRMDGYVLADLGTGSGIQAIAALKQGASFVYLLDNNPQALETALANAYSNGFDDRVEVMHPGNMFETMEEIRVNGILCNPASLPMPTPDQPNSPYFAGEDGREMISRMIVEGRNYLSEGGGLLFVQTSLANLNQTRSELWANGYIHQIIIREHLPFREFYDRDWIEKVQSQGAEPFDQGKYLFNIEGYGPVNLGQYALDDNEGLYDTFPGGILTERIYLIHAALARFEKSFMKGPRGFVDLQVSMAPNFLYRDA